ncbi:NAD(P)-dependent dehydrogenase (short-subunit alcohol dehydrogenase family) [Amycolatopsis bartoniae]|uniref:Beta-ketoacyl-ACP reductase n=1 Tax=Amycolatopsis bartoniae TaxID=941986 RepID=A0A8H9IMZ0_9PSEU|nr:3-oxoacyl-ACP reductase FabG [Amycolatopsis bartoniae]MBB2939928.1 NAD(P)-dependent dehydrogenase (short-subunit alcohol dehydrogenase family) [Amycolatopsis bartoniae]TVT08288.1 SDR family oxidoreductase [Amycolatopsis bartoniae]GHF35641.1 beta-ketoacyl-ACP reductase [Amycolatopsis bartoniae]
MTRVALVTGGAGGIGSAITRALAADGLAVAVTFASKPGRADKLVDELRRGGGRAVALRCDVGDAASVDECVSAVESELGAPQVLVNNAGVRAVGASHRFTDEDWDASIATNLTGVFAMTTRLLPAMASSGWGRVISISSPAGAIPMPGSALYGVSKAGVNQLSRVLAQEVAPDGVTVNVVAPGIVLTDMTSGMGEHLQNSMSAQSNPRTVEPEEVAAVVAFLARDEAAMVNGQVIAVDGGGPLAVPRPRPRKARQSATSEGKRG